MKQLIVGMAVSIVLGGVAVADAGIIYSLLSPPNPSGYVVTATITTNGKTGLLANSDIESIQWSTTNGIFTFGGNPVNQTISVIDLYASPTNLYFTFSSSTNIDYGHLQISWSAPGPPGSVLQYVEEMPGGWHGFTEYEALVQCFDQQFHGFQSRTEYGAERPANPWVIATRSSNGTVPEPSSLIAFTSLSLAGIGFGTWRRRKNSKLR